MPQQRPNKPPPGSDDAGHENPASDRDPRKLADADRTRDGATVADLLQEWVAETDVEGFNLAYAVTHETFQDIVDHLVPELQKRGIYKTEYANGTLRVTSRQGFQFHGVLKANLHATIAGINENVGELTRIGQSNATAAEEITATMLDLSRLAERTRIEVDEFKKLSG